MEDKVYYITGMLVYRATEAWEAKTLKMKCLLWYSNTLVMLHLLVKDRCPLGMLFIKMVL